MKGVQAIGWYLEEANMAQVSVNITDFEQTAIHTVYEEICKDAQVMFHIFIEIRGPKGLKSAWKMVGFLYTVL